MRKLWVRALPSLKVKSPRAVLNEKPFLKKSLKSSDRRLGISARLIRPRMRPEPPGSTSSNRPSPTSSFNEPVSAANANAPGEPGQLPASVALVLPPCTMSL